LDLIGLIPSFGNVLFTVGAFVVALLVIVAVHEFGHYIVARFSGIDADVFSLGMGPVLWSRVDRHGTRWQIAALPVGGYVRFSGDANAASGRDPAALAAMDEARRHRTMHGAPLWARAATVAAGPVFNFLLSIAVFAGVIGFQGIASDPLTIAALRPVPYEQGLQVGDQILAIDGRKTPALADFEPFVQALPASDALRYRVLRDGRETEVVGAHPYPPLVVALSPSSAASDAGIRAGDVILEADGTPVATFAQLRALVGQSGGKPIRLRLWRDGATLETTVTPRRVDLPRRDGGFETRWLVGITGGLLFEPQTRRPSLARALGYGAEQTWFIVRSSVSGLYHVIAGDISSCNLRGPVGIAQSSGEAASQGLTSFLWFIAVLSTAVGFLNLFPIPVLDGGHLVFHAYEAVAGRPPSDFAMRALMTVGLALILTMMVFALTNDFTCP